MAKGLKVGDIVTLRWRVTGVWSGGLIAATHPLIHAPISMHENEIPEEDVERRKGPPEEPPPKIRYEVVVAEKRADGGLLSRTILETDDRAEAYAMAGEVDGAHVDETQVKPSGRKRGR